MARYIIRRIARIHCPKGETGCKKCNEFAKKIQWAILDLSPKEFPFAKRPMIELEENGEKVYKTFDVIAYFDELDKAEQFAEKNELTLKN